MRKYLFLCLFPCLTVLAPASAQVRIGVGVGPAFGYGGYYGGMRRVYPRRRVSNEKLPPFKPIVRLNIGYGFPNLDANQFAGFYGAYRGPVTQTGPVTGSLDVQYNRTASIGLLVSHGTANTTYYSYNDPGGTPLYNASLNSWSVMLNLVQTIPTGSGISPYIRTAVGLNIWDSHYQDGSGNQLGGIPDPSQLAYQLGLGVRFPVSHHTGLFLEAGYGKYILQGGLSFQL
ncbi:MAG TPA: hypothetical protein VG842_08490 [Sediminibacterium sp.]|nr:hypothetical protein [Sediminibacterium sp.]